MNAPAPAPPRVRAPRRLLRAWRLWLVPLLAVLLYAATLRWGLSLSLTQRYAVGLAAGAASWQDRGPAAGSDHQYARFHFFRHGFTPVLWFVDRRPNPNTSAIVSTGGVVIIQPPAGQRPTPGGISLLQPSTTTSMTWLEIPLWIPFALVMAPFAVIAAVRLSRLGKPGRCVTCGYDLNGIAGPRCPECGAPFAAETTRSQPR